MAPSTDNPESSTRRADAPDFYQAYLNSTTWRDVRNRALQRAGYRCERCGGKRDFNVHHRTYERLGRERDADVEVLCFTCHNQHHRVEAERSDGIGIYVRLVSAVLLEDPWARIADISEDVKILCVKSKIPIDAPKIHRAIALVCATRLKDGQSKYKSVVDDVYDTPDPSPPTHAQAVELLTRLGFGSVVKTMSDDAPPMTEDALNAFRREFVWNR